MQIQNEEKKMTNFIKVELESESESELESDIELEVRISVRIWHWIIVAFLLTVILF